MLHDFSKLREEEVKELTPFGVELQLAASPETFSSLPLGFLLFKDFCLNEINEAVPQVKFYEEVRSDCWVSAFFSQRCIYIVLWER